MFEQCVAAGYHEQLCVDWFRRRKNMEEQTALFVMFAILTFTRMGSNQMAKETLRAAQAAKNDEFYTQWADIEKEMQAYLEYDPEVFKNKTILLPCDDPEWSNFTKYFAQNFVRFGIKKLISTSYAADSKALDTGYQPTHFEYNDSKFDASKTSSRGKIFTLFRDQGGDGKIDIDDLEWDYLEGDGDFQSDEIRVLLDEADIIITNPPFSRFRAFFAWIMEAGKSFSMIGNLNAITYKEIFPSIKNNGAWLGATSNGTDMVFGVPAGAKVAEQDRQKAARLGYVGDYTRLGNSCWFTNIEHGRRHEPLPLMTMDDNRKFNKRIQGNELAYRKYDNYSAIEVPYTNAIPSDFHGIMGVPITYLDKHNPDQFEIIGTTKPWAEGRTKMYPRQIQHGANGKKVPATKLNDGPAIRVESPVTGKTYYTVDGIPYVQMYARILIRRKTPA